MSSEEIKNDIRQCWAEAKYLYDLGELHHYADRSLLDIIRKKQAADVEDDYRVGMIEAYLNEPYEDKEGKKHERNAVCVVELWQEALNEYGKPTKRDSVEIGRFMNNFSDW